MLERFSQSALKIVMFAQEEARKGNGHVVNTEHLLMGILREREGIAFQILTTKGVNPAVVEQELAKLRLPKRPPGLMEIHFSDQLRKVFELAEDEATLLQDEKVHSEHLLLGLLILGAGKGYQILKIFELNLNRLRWFILRTRREKLAENVHTPTLDAYSEDLTRKIETQSQPTVLEWSELIESMIQYLGLSQKHSILLVGERGVGKSSLIQGLTQYILEAQIFSQFTHYRVVSLDFDRMILETQTDEMLYEKTKNIMGELKQSNDVILVIENIHQLFLANKKEMEFVITQHLLTYLSDPHSFCIATTYPHQYNTLIHQSPIENYFQVLPVPEPPHEFALAVLQHWSQQITSHHQIQIHKDCLEAVIQQTSVEAKGYLPASAITLLDLAASKKRWKQNQNRIQARQLETRLRQLWAYIEELALKQEEEKVIKVKGEINRLEEELRHYQILTDPDTPLTLSPDDLNSEQDEQL